MNKTIEQRMEQLEAGLKTLIEKTNSLEISTRTKSKVIVENKIHLNRGEQITVINLADLKDKVIIKNTLEGKLKTEQNEK